MASVYPYGKLALATKLINLDTDDIRLALVNTSYPSSSAATHQFMSSVSSYVVKLGSAALASTTLAVDPAGASATGVTFAATPYTLSAVPAANTVGFVICYEQSDGNAANQHLLAWHNLASSIATDGGDITVSFLNNVIFKF